MSCFRQLFLTLLLVLAMATGIVQAKDSYAILQQYFASLNSTSPSGVSLIRSTQSLLAMVLHQVQERSNGSHKLHLYVLGDSVTRMLVSNWMLKWGGPASKDSLQTKSAAEIKDLCNNRGSTEAAYRSDAPCLFETEKLKSTFSWVQWFSFPHPLPSSVHHFQAIDSCYGKASLEDCLQRTFNGSTSDDVAVIRIGLEYLFYSFEGLAAHACEGADPSSSCHLPQWQDEVKKHAAHFIRTAKAVFPGTVVYLLLTPFGKNAACYGSYVEIGPRILELNDILRTIFIEENALFIDPYALHEPFINTAIRKKIATNFGVLDPNWFGYFDCAHFAEPMTTLMLNRLLTTVIRQLPSEDLF
eukprot:gene6358-4567_t